VKSKVHFSFQTESEARYLGHGGTCPLSAEVKNETTPLLPIRLHDLNKANLNVTEVIGLNKLGL
jgi:hypothetical protein